MMIECCVQGIEASLGWTNAWTSASGLMAVTLCAVYGHAMWVVVLM